MFFKVAILALAQVSPHVWQRTDSARPELRELTRILRDQGDHSLLGWLRKGSRVERQYKQLGKMFLEDESRECPSSLGGRRTTGKAAWDPGCRRVRRCRRGDRGHPARRRRAQWPARGKDLRGVRQRARGQTATRRESAEALLGSEPDPETETAG